jgi:hypothetical protein
LQRAYTTSQCSRFSASGRLGAIPDGTDDEEASRLYALTAFNGTSESVYERGVLQTLDTSIFHSTSPQNITHLDLLHTMGNAPSFIPLLFPPPKPKWTADDIPDLSGRVVIITGQPYFHLSAERRRIKPDYHQVATRESERRPRR